MSVRRVISSEPRNSSTCAHRVRLVAELTTCARCVCNRRGCLQVPPPSFPFPFPFPWTSPMWDTSSVLYRYMQQASYGALVALVHSTSDTSQRSSRYTRNSGTSALIHFFALFHGYWLLKYHESESRGRGAVRDWSKFSGSQVGSGPERALGGLPSWGNRSGGRDHGGEPDHVPARLRGPGLSQEHIRFELKSSKSVG